MKWEVISNCNDSAIVQHSPSFRGEKYLTEVHRVYRLHDESVRATDSKDVAYLPLHWMII